MSEDGGGAVFGCDGGGCRTRSMSSQDHLDWGTEGGAMEGETISLGGGGGIRGSGGCSPTDAPLTEGIVGATRADFSSLLICFILRKEKPCRFDEY